MTDGSPPADRPRPAVSVVVPFFGDVAAARRLAGSLAGLRLRDGDEVLVADNTPQGVAAAIGSGRSSIRVVQAYGELSSYFARNVGAEAAANEWLLFTDADCVPEANLLDAYFEQPAGESVGGLAGTITGAANQSGLLAEWARTRGILNQERLLADQGGAATANLMVRAQGWRAVGGFQEGIRSGGDLEFCWRLVDAGWAIEPRPEARVAHLHRERLRSALGAMARYSAGNAWHGRRRPGSAPPLGLAASLARAAGGMIWFGLTLRFRRAALKGLDGLAAVAQATGRGLGNRAVSVRPDTAGGATVSSLVIATDRYPVPSETFVSNEIATLAARGVALSLEAVARPERPVLGGGRVVRPRYLEDEGSLDRAAALAASALRHPLRCVADLHVRRRFSPDELLPLRAIAPLARRLEREGAGHVHVHFGALACVNAIRAGRIAGVQVSFTGHGHELFVTPRALPGKIAHASFVVAPCEYTARYLRSRAPAGLGERVRVVVMGVDGESFRRRKTYPGGKTVAAIGRLVEKKGFADLIAAAARLADGDALARVLIAGEGPLRAQLAEAIAGFGLEDTVELVGSLTPAGVRELLERSDVVAVPCVVAGNGDRDAMPVVAKEALAMGIPVVATDEVGLPELIRDDWGRLVAPGDPEALAGALSELLSRPADERAAMGAAGREFVLAHFSLDAQVDGLLALIGEAGSASVYNSPR